MRRQKEWWMRGGGAALCASTRSDHAAGVVVEHRTKAAIAEMKIMKLEREKTRLKSMLIHT